MIGVRFPVGAGNLSSPPLPDRLWANPASYPLVTGGYFPGVKRPRREADHLPPSSAEVEESVKLYLHSQYVFMVWCLVKHRDNFTFYPPYPEAVSSNPKPRTRHAVVIGTHIT
jgi:hypothetical protein